MVRLIGLATVVASVLVVVSAAAQDATYESPSAAAEAAFVELLPEWHVAGDCSAAMGPGPSDVCYRFTPGRSTNAFSIYSAYALESAGSAWWAGVTETDDGWKSYDTGRCDLDYCRMTAPGDVLLVGFPSGDGNCDGEMRCLCCRWSRNW